MSLRLICRLLLALLVILPAAALAQTAATVRGTITDPDGAVIPTATITLTAGVGKSVTTQSTGDGSYTLRNVAPGTYSLTVTMTGFGSYVKQGIKIAAGQSLTQDVKLAIQEQTTEVMVTAEAAQVSTDQDSNASAMVLKGKDLDALSDDPDDLANELSALAGPAAGPNGGQIYVDGFTGGALPPKSSIREIRVNQNPFSAQYERLGFGRVEVFTKPGTDKFHGQLQMNGNSSAFNTGNPQLKNAPQLPYHTIFTFGNITGPISKISSFSFGGSYRTIQDDSVVDPAAIFTNPTTGAVCPPGNTTGCTLQLLNQNGYTASVLLPQTRYDLNPRFDLAIGEKNTLTLRFQHEHNSQQNNGVGGNSIFSAGNDSTSYESELQVSDTQILSPRVINETRFEYNWNGSTQSPHDTSPTINVQGAFNGGGSSSGITNSTGSHVEVQNYTSIALGKNFIRFGGRMRSNQNSNTTTAGTNGIFTYNYLVDPCTIASNNCASTTACSAANATGGVQRYSSYQCGQVAQFSKTIITTPNVSARVTDVGLYAEDDWKARPNLTFSYGIRFETQNATSDHADFSPRISFAYGIGKAKSTPKTVLRGGYGIFYDRYGVNSQLNIDRSLGQSQITAQGNLPATCTPSSQATCGTGGLSTIRSAASNLRAPYTLLAALGFDQQLFKGATMSVNYLNARGVHQYLSENVGPLTSAGGINYQYQSEGVFRQNQLIANMRYSGPHAISLFGYYVLNFANGDSNGLGSFPSVPFNPGADYGRTNFDVRQRIFLGGNMTLPFRISLSPLIIASAGNPYNITTGTDLNGDSIYNDRPAFVNSQTLPQNIVVTPLGTFDVKPAAGVARIPINYGTSPSLFTMNLRVAKTFGFGPSTNPNANTGQGGRGGGDHGPGPVVGGGGQRGGGDHGGGGGMFGGGGGSTGRRYNMTLGVQGQNIFNVVDRGSPSAVLTAPASTIGVPTGLAGSTFTSGSAVRRVSLQMSFSF